MANNEKLIFPIGFDLEEGVAKVEKDWGKMQNRLQDTFKSQTIQVDADISKEVLDKLYAKFEGLIKTMESKAPQIKLKMPDTVDFEQEINRLKVQLKSINLGELTDAESKDLYLYIRQLEALAKALKEVNKQEQLRQANNPANIALQEARAQEKLTRAKANDALAEQRRAATARAEQAELRLTQAKQRSANAIERQNAAYKTQGGYLQRLFQRMVAYASVAQAFSFIRNIREVTAQFELQRVALGSIIGDLNEANAMFEQIKAAAVKSPFQIKELVTYTKQLAAYKIETDELFETTQRLADVSAGLGVGMERLVLAYGQIRATGYLRASEVRQLTEAGIPIVEELAKKMSQLRGETVSAAEVMQLISERAISFGMVKEVFDDMTSAGGMFYKMQEKQAETLAGQWSNLQDAISIMYEEIGNTERVNNAIKGTIDLVKSLAENWRVVGDAAVWSVGVAMGYTKVIKPISELIKKQKLLNKAKEAEIKAEKNLARVRQLNAEKAEYLAQDEWVNDAWLEATEDQIKAHQEYADKHTKIATEARKSAASLKGFGGALKSIGSFIKANWVGMLITAITAVVSWLISARQEANRLNKELAKIGTEGTLQADQSVRNFERLAKAIRESADGSEKQTTALVELKRSYGDLLPSQDKEIKSLVQEKANYDALIGSIRKKIELQIQEQKVNTIASEYGSRFTKWEGKIKKESIFGTLSTQEIDIFISEIKKSVDEGLIATTNDAETNGLELKRILEGIVGNIYGSLSNTYFANIKSIRKLIETQEEYNKSIDSVGGALDRLDGKGKKISDTFNTWQKELQGITEGKNDLGEGVRVFDDESISQINKLTNATKRVAEEYDRLAKEKKQVDKALASEGAKTDKATYAQLEKRLGRIKIAMSGMHDFLKKYGALELIKSDDKEVKTAEQALKDELSAVEKIYKRYQELRKLKSDTSAKEMLAEEFKDVDLNVLSTAFSYEDMLAQYQKALAEAQRLGKKDLVLEIQTKIGELKVSEETRKLEKQISDLSREISHTKTAKNFFENMLNLTGDKKLSATLTMQVYGMEADKIADNMYEQLKREAQSAFGDLDISKAFNDATKKIDYSYLMDNLDKVAEKNQKNARDFVDKGIQTNAEWLTNLYQTYQKSFTFEERRTRVRANAERDIADIQAKGFHDAQKQAEAITAVQTKLAQDLASIDLEEFKQGSDYTKMFDDLEKVATPTISRLLDELKRFIEEHKDLPIDQVKALMDLYQKLYDESIKRSPFKAITDGIDEYIEASKRVANAKKNLSLENGTEDEELIAKAEQAVTDALDEQAKALQKTQLAVQATSEVFESAATQVNELAIALGFAEDSDISVFLGGMAKAFSFLATAISLGQMAMKLFDETTKKFMASNPLGWVLLIASAIVGAISAISNAKVRKAEKDIEKLNRKLEDLQYAYKQLEKEQEDAFGTNYIDNYKRRLDILEAQEKAYLKQAEKERSKGKKADEEKIRDYEDAARDAKDAIEDMQTELSEHFLGTDLTSAARDFASAWIDAYKSFGNTTEAMKEKFKDMIQNMITESLIAKVMERALKPVFDLIDQMGDTDFYSPSFWSNLMTEMEKATENGVVGATNVMSMLEQIGINLRDTGEGMTGISRDIATASEESILGLAAGINTQNFYISQVPPKLDTIIALLQGGGVQVGGEVNMRDLFTLQNQYLLHLPTIAQHTAETVAECKAIVVETRRTADALEKVIKPRGTQSSYTINTTLN